MGGYNKVIFVYVVLFLGILFLTNESELVFAANESQESGANCGGAVNCNCGDLLTQSHNMSYNITGCVGSGLEIGADNITLDCNDYTIGGTNVAISHGINLRHDNLTTIKNCNIMNFQHGIVLVSNSSYNNFSNNILRDNIFSGIYVNALGPFNNYNNIWDNDFINNSIENAHEDAGMVGNNWNSSETGNFWDDFIDNSGYPNNYEIDGPSSAIDYKPKSVVITDLIPIQVVEDVDLVKDKNTLVRASINGSLNSNVTVKMFLEGEEKNSTVIGFDSSGGIKPVNLWFKPNIGGNNKTIRVEVNIGRHFDNMTESVNVIDTRDLSIAFVSIDNPVFLDKTFDDSIDFIQRTYPLADNALETNENEIKNNENSITSNVNSKFDLDSLLLRMHLFTILSSDADSSIGIVPPNWFEDFPNISGDGYSIGPFSFAVIIEENILHNAAHELGHTFSLCDEYNISDEWKDQNTIFGFCPNGDSNPDDGILDSICLDFGCNVTTIGTLVPWVDSNDTVQLTNFMGSTDIPPERWVSKDTYLHLLDRFKDDGFISSSSRITVGGIFNKSNNHTDFMNSYIIGSGSAINESKFSKGNFSIRFLDEFNNTIFNISFNLSFVNIFSNGTTEETNTSVFSFVMPNFGNIDKILFLQNNIIQEEKNKTISTPSLNIINPPLNEIFSNQLFNVSWNSSDLDNDTLSYSILFSPDNGSDYITLQIDYNQTNLTINSSNLQDCDLCRIKVLATDGINTNTSVSNTFNLDNDLQINNFSIVYSNNTQRIFNLIYLIHLIILI